MGRQYKTITTSNRNEQKEHQKMKESKFNSDNMEEHKRQ